MSIDRVGVIGGGQMGAGIAEAAATTGCDVVVHEISPEACEAARSRIEKSLQRAVDRGKLEGPDRDASLARLSFSTELGDQADRQLVIEAVTENEELKSSIFGSLVRRSRTRRRSSPPTPPRSPSRACPPAPPDRNG